MLPTGATEKKYMTEKTKLMNGWTKNLTLKRIAFKAIQIFHGAMERLTSFYLREKQFNHVYITSTHQKASMNYLKSLLF